MIGAPPSLAGAEKVTEALASPGAARPITGEAGNVAGVTLFETADAGLLPSSLAATTTHVTGIPMVKPLSVMGEAEPDWDCPPHVAV